MNTSQIKNFAVQSRQVLKTGVLNRIIALGFDIDGNVTTERPTKIQGGSIFMGQLREEGFYDAWMALEHRIKVHGVKEACEEAAYTWFNRLVAIRIMQKNDFIDPVMEYVSDTSRIPRIVAEARSGRLSLKMSAANQEKLNDLLRDPSKINEQFNLLITAFCDADPVIFNCFGGIEKDITLLLPDNILAQGGFIDLLNNTSYISEEDYKQSELIGWLYQFYISEKKDEVFDSFKKGKKAEAEDIPAATQIFTPNWIVKYMVQNTLGRIYLDNNLYSALGEDMKYLVKTDEQTPEDAILHLDDLQEYKMIDPACGSGHILVEAFELLFSMYQEEAYPTKKAIEQILTKNIIGIDLDTRAKQLATFALLLKACQKDRSFLDCKIMPRVLDMPESFEYSGLLKEFFAHFGISGASLVNECVEAFELLKQASNLGSIMNFNLSPSSRTALERRTAEWEASEYIPQLIRDAMPSIKLILALTDKYTAVVANPPYMGAGNMNGSLKSYVVSKYPTGKADLFAVFMLVGMNLLSKNGKMGMINMHSWMFLSTFEKLRETFLSSYHIDNLLHLGSNTFDELPGEVVQNSSFVLSKSNVQEWNGHYYRLVFGDNCKEKKIMFERRSNEYNILNQNFFFKIPGSPIGYWASNQMIEIFQKQQLGKFCPVKKGMDTGNNDYFLRYWHEVNSHDVGYYESNDSFNAKGYKWAPYNKGGHSRKWFGNNEIVVLWANNGEELEKSSGNLRSRNLYFQRSITWNALSTSKPTARLSSYGALFDSAGSSMFPNESSILYTLGFMNSVCASEILFILNPTLNYGAGTVSKVPIITCERPSIDRHVHENIELSKKDWNSHEIAWDFKTNELLRMKHNCSGNVADLDLLEPKEAKEIMEKYKIPTNRNLISDCLSAYKSEWTRNFIRLHFNEEELNRQFIEIYGLQDELTPDVSLEEITILQQGEISIEHNDIVWHDDVIIKQLLSYAVGCWMGRYRLDKEGLNIAYYPTPEEVCSYDVNGYTFDIDDDAIIPLMGKDTPFEDDNAHQKIVNFVKMAFGEDSLSGNLNFIEHCLGKSIEDYLVKDFWKDHKKMYQNRPIYWLFSSKKGAFQVLTYMHRMNPYTVEKIRTKYLLPYIEHLKGKIENDEARGADLTTVERKNLTKMKVALEECLEYHDRLHDVAIKNIAFDLDDGVVVNYAKFGDVLAKIK